RTPEEKDTHIIIFARAYKDGKKEGAHTKTADEKQEKTEKRKANLQTCKTCSISTHTRARTL
ncbi:hypothetical protein SAMN04487923_10151, partial [Phocaeicola vulgatus]|uniref:hypothetical protein n=1 Tax=Phocaeicola vulgatus TaxID=821 RepID=UPI0008D0AEBD